MTNDETLIYWTVFVVNIIILKEILGLGKLASASASWFWPHPWPRRFVLGLGLGDLSSASRICPHLTSLVAAGTYTVVQESRPFSFFIITPSKIYKLVCQRKVVMLTGPQGTGQRPKIVASGPRPRPNATGVVRYFLNRSGRTAACVSLDFICETL